MKTISKIVVKSVMSETLVNGQPDVVEPSDFHDTLPFVVVEGIIRGVAHHLIHFDHWLVIHVRTRHVVLVHGDLLIRTCLTTF